MKNYLKNCINCVTIYIIIENLIAVIIFSNNFKWNEIWIKILNEKNPLIFFRYTVSPAYEQFIAQNNRLSIKPCLLNICSDINETIVIILLRDITDELSPCKRVNIVSKIEFTVLRV